MGRPLLAALALVLAGCVGEASGQPGEDGEPTDFEEPVGGEEERAEGEDQPLPRGLEPTRVPAARPGESLLMRATAEDGTSRVLRARDLIREGEMVAFELAADPAGDEYLYLLERTGSDARIIHPRMGRVMAARHGPQRVVPRHAWQSEEEYDAADPVGWRMGGGGWAEYLLVATPSPRDESSSGNLGSVDRFLLGAPYVRGRAARPGRVVAALVVLWE